jgi:cobalt-zinc-cadmium efflux system outer membrane protein
MQELEAARSSERLARAERFPEPSLFAFYEREEGLDRIAGGGISIPLPLFDRNQGGVLSARAEVARREAELAAAGLAAEQETIAALAAYSAASSQLDVLDRRVVGSLAENLDLVTRSFQAGRLGLGELVAMRRRLIESRRSRVAALRASWEAWAQLELALGLPSIAPQVLTNRDEGRDP